MGGEGDGCFYIGPVTMNWFQAQSFCSTLYKGSHLLEVKDVTVDYDLGGKTKANKLYWLGGTDMARVRKLHLIGGDPKNNLTFHQEGQWRWSHSNELFYTGRNRPSNKYSNWYGAMNPDNGSRGSGPENCLEFMGNDNMWNDANCRLTNHHPICFIPEYNQKE